MPLIQSAAAIAGARILDHITRLAGNYEASARSLNDITTIIVGLDNAALTEFANNIGPAEMMQLTTLHGLQGEAMNQLLADCNSVMASVGLPQSTATVDVRPLADKLLAQRREIGFDGTTFTVTTLPDPEPVPLTAEQIAEQERQAAEMEARMAELETARNLPLPPAP